MKRSQPPKPRAAPPRPPIARLGALVRQVLELLQQLGDKEGPTGADLRAWCEAASAELADPELHDAIILSMVPDARPARSARYGCIAIELTQDEAAQAVLALGHALDVIRADTSRRYVTAGTVVALLRAQIGTELRTLERNRAFAQPHHGHGPAESAYSIEWRPEAQRFEVMHGTAHRGLFTTRELAQQFIEEQTP